MGVGWSDQWSFWQERYPGIRSAGAPYDVGRDTGGIQMRLRSFVCLVIGFSSLFSFGCVGPWPSISVDSQGLGKGKIADYLRLPAWDSDEKRIAAKVSNMLTTADKDLQPRVRAESIGMSCESLPSKKCRYTGVVKYQAHGTPKENIDAGKPTIISIEITLPNHDEPNSLVVKKTKTILQ